MLHLAAKAPCLRAPLSSNVRRHMRPIVSFSLATYITVSLHTVALSAEPSRPTGKNCDLSAPPTSAGEEVNHNSVLRVFPRRSSISATYSGCQAVFVTPSENTPQLLWLIEIRRGDPVRMWSPRPDMRDQQDCRYKNGTLVRGRSEICSDARTLLMPSLPAGCLAKEVAREPSECRYDWK